MSKKKSSLPAFESTTHPLQNIGDGEGPVMVFRKEEPQTYPFGHVSEEDIGGEFTFGEEEASALLCVRCGQVPAIGGNLCLKCTDLHNSLSRIASETSKPSSGSSLSLSEELGQYYASDSPSPSELRRPSMLPSTSLLEELIEEVQQIPDPENPLQKQNFGQVSLSPTEDVISSPLHSLPSDSFSHHLLGQAETYQPFRSPEPQARSFQRDEPSSVSSSVRAQAFKKEVTKARRMQYHKAAMPENPKKLKTLPNQSAFQPLDSSILPRGAPRTSKKESQLTQTQVSDVDLLLQDLISVEYAEISPPKFRDPKKRKRLLFMILVFFFVFALGGGAYFFLR